MSDTELPGMGSPTGPIRRDPVMYPPLRERCTYTDDQFEAGVTAMVAHHDDPHTQQVGGFESMQLAHALEAMGFVHGREEDH